MAKKTMERMMSGEKTKAGEKTRTGRLSQPDYLELEFSVN